MSADRAKMDLVDRLIADWERERPDLNTEGMGGVGRILHLSHLLERRINRRIKPYQISYTDLDLLATLRRSGDPFTLTPEQLRQSVLLTSGAMTAAINRLVKRGHLMRRQDAQDRRVRRITLTAKGRALIEEVIVLRFKEAEEAMSGLTPAEQNRLYTLLRKLGSGLGA